MVVWSNPSSCRPWPHGLWITPNDFQSLTVTVWHYSPEKIFRLVSLQCYFEWYHCIFISQRMHLRSKIDLYYHNKIILYSLYILRLFIALFLSKNYWNTSANLHTYFKNYFCKGCIYIINTKQHCELWKTEFYLKH